jgi:hypothetical protein
VYQELFLFGRSLLGRLEGVDPDVFGLDFQLLVGGEIAETRHPLLLGSRGYGTDGANGPFDDAITALALLDDEPAGMVLESTAAFSPKGTLGTGKNSLTLHG